MSADPWLFHDAPQDPAAAAPDETTLAKAFARCFAGDDGQRVLDHLRATTLHRPLGPDASDAALRHLEGQRVLVARILALIAQGGGTPFSRH